MKRTLLRWLITDPEYQRRFLTFLSRSLPRDRLLTRGLMVGAVGRGIMRDLRNAFGGTKAAS